MGGQTESLDRGLVPPTHDGAVVTPEQAAKRELFEQVARMYGLKGEVAALRAENLVVNLNGLKGLTRRVGYYYGMPPHRMSPEMVDELRKVGKSFLKGSELQGGHDRFLDAGLDIFKTIAVDLDTPEYLEWQRFLNEKTSEQK